MRAVVLWWGRLVEKKGVRSELDKWQEKILGVSVWERITKILQQQEQIEEVIYCGSSEKPVDRVRYENSAKTKFFFKTLEAGLSCAEDDESVLVVAGDLPLLTTKGVSELLSKNSVSTGLQLFYTTNLKIQSTYPEYNPDKRFASLSEGDIVFANAFIVQKATWSQVMKTLDGALTEAHPNILPLIRILWTIPQLLLLQTLVHSNIKAFDSLRYISFLQSLIRKPSLYEDILPVISKKLGVIVSAAPVSPEFSIDFDRRSQAQFFENTLS